MLARCVAVWSIQIAAFYLGNDKTAVHFLSIHQVSLMRRRLLIPVNPVSDLPIIVTLSHGHLPYDKDIYRIVAWHKPRDRIEAPPLVINGQTVTEPEAKAEGLRMALLERNSEDKDLKTGRVPTVPRRRLLCV